MACDLPDHLVDQNQFKLTLFNDSHIDMTQVHLHIFSAFLLRFNDPPDVNSIQYNVWVFFGIGFIFSVVPQRAVCSTFLK